MAEWSRGYVTEVPYTSGYYEDLDPARLAFAVLSQGFRAPPLSEPFSYCELGCGRGVTTTIVAAGNPRAVVWANDFNPTHVAEARRLSSGLANVQFSDAGFDEIASDLSIPQFDFIILHGIYSWINEDLRQSIVEFAKRKLAIGGVLYVSYNSKPGWTPGAPVAELMRLHAERQGSGAVFGKIAAAKTFVDQVISADSAFFKANPIAKAKFKEISSKNASYVAHEYMNESWSVFSHADVVRDFSEAKLTYIGSSALLDHLPNLMLTPDQAKVIREVPDPVLREVTRDYIVNQQFRRDLFIKGPLKLSRNEMEAAWSRLRFAAVRLPDDKDLTPRTRLGPMRLRPEIYVPILTLLDQRPHTVAELLADPTVAALGALTVRSALLTLSAFRRIAPALGAADEGERSKSASTLNQTLLESAAMSSDIQLLVSPVNGGGVGVPRLSQLFLLAEKSGASPVDFAWETLSANNERMTHEGKRLETAEENIAQLSLRHETFTRSRHLLQQLGIVS